MKNIALISALTASVLAINTQAGDLYLEGGLGNTKLEANSESENGAGFGLLMGYKFLDLGQVQISGELGYNRYANIDDFGGVDNLTVNVSSVGIGTKLNFQPVDKVNLFGRLGYEKYDVEAEFDLGGASISNTDVQHSMTYAVGGSYDVSKEFAVGTQYKYAELDNDLDLSNMSLFATYSF